MPAPQPDVTDDFDTAALDAAVWLPAWGSKAATAVTYDLRDSDLPDRSTGGDAVAELVVDWIRGS